MNPAVKTPGGDIITLACGGCIAFVPLTGSTKNMGECHKGPPTVVLLTVPDTLHGRMKQTVNATFPGVPQDSWCMGFMPRPTLNDAGIAQEGASDPAG